MTHQDACPFCGAEGRGGNNKYPCGTEIVCGTPHRTRLCKLNEAAKELLKIGIHQAKQKKAKNFGITWDNKEAYKEAVRKLKEATL